MGWRRCGRPRPKADQAFLDYLLDLADESKISDPETCWYAPKAGMSDDVRRSVSVGLPARDSTVGDSEQVAEKKTISACF